MKPWTVLGCATIGIVIMTGWPTLVFSGISPAGVPPPGVPTQRSTTPTPTALKPYSMENGWLTWSWEGTVVDPTVDEYVLECGQVRGVYTVSKIFPIKQIDVLMTDVVGRTPGDWFCLMTTMAKGARMATSNEFSFNLLGRTFLKGKRK